MNKGRKIALMAAAPGVIAFLFMLSAASRGAWGELSSNLAYQLRFRAVRLGCDHRAPGVLLVERPVAAKVARATRFRSICLDRESTCGYTGLMASKNRKVRNQFPVREAKNRFSELVRRVAEGEEIIITSHGEARARLCPIRRGARPFEVDWKWLRGMRVADTQRPAETLVRAERDARD